MCRHMRERESGRKNEKRSEGARERERGKIHTYKEEKRREEKRER